MDWMRQTNTQGATCIGIAGGLIVVGCFFFGTIAWNLLMVPR